MKRVGIAPVSVVMSLLASSTIALRRAAAATTGRTVRGTSALTVPGAAFLGSPPTHAFDTPSSSTAVPPLPTSPGASLRRRGLVRLYSTTDPKPARPVPSTPYPDDDDYDDDVDSMLLSSGYARPLVNWYPGHIAKAERLLSETLKSVDVVVEVRDARCPKATAHPRVAEWSAGRPRVVVLTHADTVTSASRGSWKKAYEELGAGRWDASVDGQVRNAALQAWRERKRWKVDDPGPSSSSKGGKKGGGGKAQPQLTVREDLDLSSQVEGVLFVDAKRGQGVRGINRAVLRAGSHVNERRARRGLNERPLRVGVIGFPNVGKSALINKMIGRRRAKTANTPGITRSLQWIRVRSDDAKRESRGKEFELLDSPGIIPAHMVDQSDALLLAACNSVGNAAYDNQAVAAYLCEWLKTLHLMRQGETMAPRWRTECLNRYGFDPLEEQPVSVIGSAPGDGSEKEMRLPTGEDILFLVADNKCRGNPEDAARKILQDFRGGRMGLAALQLAPRRAGDGGQTKVDVRRGVAESLGGDLAERGRRSLEERRREERESRDRRAKAAVETALERGLELPPVVESAGAEVEAEEEEDGDSAAPEAAQDEIGKGMFDGW